MATFSKEVPDDRLKRCQFDELILEFLITGTKTASQMTLQAAPCLIMFDTGDSTQAAVDSLLGTASDITYATSFSSTSLGTDSVGFVISHGSAKKLISVKCESIQVTGGTPTNFIAHFAGAGAATAVLPSSLTNAFSVTPAGHIYGHCVLTNIDSVSAGSLRLVIRFEAA